MKRYVGYTRVSTDKQGKEGYGSADQLQTINEFVKNDELLQVFQEEESGSKNDRPELNKALADCKKHKTMLSIRIKLNRFRPKSWSYNTMSFFRIVKICYLKFNSYIVFIRAIL